MQNESRMGDSDHFTNSKLVNNSSLLCTPSTRVSIMKNKTRLEEVIPEDARRYHSPGRVGSSILARARIPITARATQ